MKLILVLLVVFTAQTFAVDFLGCFSPILENINQDGEKLVAWREDVSHTAERLKNHKQLCKNLPRHDPPIAFQERIIQACEAAFTASVAYEINRLVLALKSIDPDFSQNIKQLLAQCF